MGWKRDILSTTMFVFGALIALNLSSFDKYEETLATGGTLVVNQSMVDREAKRGDINVIFVPCNEIADKKLMNMVAVGALLTALPELTLKDIEKSLEAHLPARHKHLLPKNYEALKRGKECRRNPVISIQ
jgi:2-oxoglutarate ferredoxin oxidoreductase subunit gamma